jgi:uncharacterized protein (TIGR02246 family)
MNNIQITYNLYHGKFCFLSQEDKVKFYNSSTAHGIYFAAVSKINMMESNTVETKLQTDRTEIQYLYEQLVDSWNKMNSNAYAALFTEDGSIVGFDGSQANSRKDIHDHLSEIFTDHQPAKFITIIREIRFLSPSVGLLRAVAGMVPRGKAEINPKTNAIQSLVAIKKDDHFLIAMFQNTPAAYHGRPQLAEQLTKELQQQLEIKMQLQ